MKSANGPVLPADLPEEWRDRSRLFREHEETSVALAYEKCADALEKALREGADAPLTLTEASDLSGYSTDHLGRLVREGRIANAGRPGAPRIARGDLPVRAGVVRHPQNLQISRTEVVQSAIRAGDQ